MRRIIAVTLLVSAAVAYAASSQPKTQRSSKVPPPASTAGAIGTLYDQTSNNSGWGFWAQEQEAANAAFSRELADDFIVPVGD